MTHIDLSADQNSPRLYRSDVRFYGKQTANFREKTVVFRARFKNDIGTMN